MKYLYSYKVCYTLWYASGRFLKVKNTYKPKPQTKKPGRLAMRKVQGESKRVAQGERKVHS